MALASSKTSYTVNATRMSAVITGLRPAAALAVMTDEAMAH